MSDSDSGQGGTVRRRAAERLAPTDLLLIAVAASFWPLSVMASNVVGMPHAERLLVLVLGVFALSLITIRGLQWFGVDRALAVRSVFLGTVVVMTWGRLYSILPPIMVVLSAVAVVVIGIFLLTRVREHFLIEAFFVGLAVTLAGGPAVSLWAQASDWGTDHSILAQAPGVDFVEKPDIYLVVLDGYPGPMTMESDFDHEPGALITTLDRYGVDLSRSAWSSYPTTVYSIPSLLQLNYPIEVDTGDLATEQAMHDVISGDNNLVRILNDAGYTTYMVESGWSGSSCRAWYDHCIASPYLDEALYLALEDTLLAPLLTSTNHPFTAGTLSTIEWLDNNVATLQADGRPSFVFAHFLAPHPPFYLDASCEIVLSPDRESPFVTPATEEFFLEQVACVDDAITDISKIIDEDSVAVFVADHGTASRHQLNTPPAEWTDAGVTERMHVFAAVHAAPGCALTADGVIPNLMRSVLSCYTSEPVPTIRNRMFISEMVEISPTELSGFVDSS